MPPTPDATFIALQRALAGRFSLERELGRGGMGVVYLARDVILERPVAIKLLAPSLSARDEMRRRFLREARIAAQCFHPHIVPIHEVAESGELAWFVMAYVPGETLADRLRRVGPLNAEVVRRIGREIGWALSYAHERGVVHRDVKPENILLERGSDRALIADFGIAWHDPAVATGQGVLSSGEVAGTARFMAPEQAMGEKVDGRADLYALGVTLHLAATGQYPFEGKSAMAVVAQQVAARAPAVRTRAPQLAESLGDAIDRCLEMAPDDRFATAAEFVATLDRSTVLPDISPETRSVRAAASGAFGIAEWSVSISIAATLMVMGEAVGGLGHQLMQSVAAGIVSFLGIATAIRGGEALFEARRALKSGAEPDGVATALVPPEPLPDRANSWGWSSAAIVVGSALAYFQAAVDKLQIPYEMIELAANVSTWVLPTLFLQRGLSFQWQASGLGAWFRRRIAAPLAGAAVRLLGGETSGVPPRAVPSSSPTEMLVGQATEALFALLPADARAELSQLPAAAAALAEHATKLRAQDQVISAELRLARNAHAAPDRDARVEALEAERAAVQGRLGTTIAALESLRLDLLRLRAGEITPGNLTEQLEMVREFARQVDAVAEVERVVAPRDPRPEPTPV
ncbi:MAG: serine/threonine-protein kinase [Gemmatimonadaceae bacterium]